MATPVGDSYAVASGGVIAAGRYRWPAWRRSIASGTVAQIGINKLSDLDPKNNPAINPVYPASPEWHGAMGQAGIVIPWCGAAWDEWRGLFVLGLNGGHQDYAGNESYIENLYADDPAWVMPRPPSGAVENLLTTNDGLEATGNYADGRPRAIHSYNKHVATPAGIVLIVQGNTAWLGSAGTFRTMLLDVDTGEWEVKTTHPAPGASTSGAAGCYDSLRNRIWYKPASDGRPSWLNLDTWSWTAQSGWAYDSSWTYKRLVYLPEHDLILQADANKSGGFCLWSPTTGTIYQPGVSGSPPDGLVLSGISGCDWDGERLLVWHNSRDTNVIGTLTPGANPIADPWTWGQVSFSGATPTARVSNGTYGRFAYSRRLKGCVLQNLVGDKPFFFALG